MMNVFCSSTVTGSPYAKATEARQLDAGLRPFASLKANDRFVSSAKLTFGRHPEAAPALPISKDDVTAAQRKLNDAIARLYKPDPDSAPFERVVIGSYPVIGANRAERELRIEIGEPSNGISKRQIAFSLDGQGLRLTNIGKAPVYVKQHGHKVEVKKNQPITLSGGFELKIYYQVDGENKLRVVELKIQSDTDSAPTEERPPLDRPADMTEYLQQSGLSVEQQLYLALQSLFLAGSQVKAVVLSNKKVYAGDEDDQAIRIALPVKPSNTEIAIRRGENPDDVIVQNTGHTQILLFGPGVPGESQRAYHSPLKDSGGEVIHNKVSLVAGISQVVHYEPNPVSPLTVVTSMEGGDQIKTKIEFPPRKDF